MSVVCECNDTCGDRSSGNGGGGGGAGDLGDGNGISGGGTSTGGTRLNVYVTVELVATIS